MVIYYADSKPQIYYMAIIDVLTVYGARKRAAHAAKTFKTRVSNLVKTGVLLFILFFQPAARWRNIYSKS